MATLSTISHATGDVEDTPEANILSRPKRILGSLIALDLLGVILMLMGLRQQLHPQGLFLESLNVPYAGVMMLTAGVVLTLPFFISSIKAAFGSFNKKSQ
ncbi:hypothetical protein [uncultured Paraglaciecola sp.]|uniref:hypothetical protein n=1 Tax=uncultured Paraglaciecola sp. TaxID=1765024 RepID=UPI0030DBC73F|tara:strand:- start:16648 stop:16947 length:300 start_codon:yes stop_codon:yes gene_type:complete